MTIKKLQPKDDKSVISEEYYKEKEQPKYICSMCNQMVLVKLRDAGNNNISYWCKMCQVSFDPECESLQEDTNVSLPYDEEEGSGIISLQTDITKDVEINHTVPIHGAFAELQKKGLRIKDYHTTEKG